MIFKKRTTSPSTTNKYYIKTGKGGYNRAMEINKVTHSCLPNCCGLVHGRWMESQNQTNYNKYDKLCTGDAHSYYIKKDGYQRGQTPKLGAIICFDKKGGAGHVAFVEEIKNNGDVVASNSAYNGTRFYMKTYKKKDNYNFGNYKFQGFIYSPINFEKQFNLTRLLKKGCKGDDVKKLQQELIKKGYDLGKYGDDGVFGNDTYKAVKYYQIDKKLHPIDGIVGRDTAHSLGWLYRNE